MTQESVWIDDHNPYWVNEELMRRAILVKPMQSHSEIYEFVALLRMSAINKDLDRGTKLHGDIMRRGLLEKSPYLASSVIYMYSKCGVASKAQQVLDELSVRNVVSWNALISGYAHQGKGYEALDCFERMLSEGLSPNVITFICILKACSSTNNIRKGEQIHEDIRSRGLLEKNIVLSTALVDMYVKCGMIRIAQDVLKELPIRDTVSWNALIAGYAKYGLYHEALKCFEQMQSEGLSPNGVTFICMLKACGSIGAIEKGKQIHENILNRGLLAKDISLGNTLVDMYAKCGFLTKARKVLEELPVRDVVSWNALIAGYVQEGQGYEALNCFEHMKSEELHPDAITFISLLQACSSIGAINTGIQIHDEIISRGLLKKDIVLGTTLVDMYAKHGELVKAQKVLEELPIRNAISWNALISGYAQKSQFHEALDCFARMQREGLSPDVATFVCLLKSCNSTEAIDKGMQIHNEIVRRGLLKMEMDLVVLSTALVDMYAKCGMFAKAQEVLEEFSMRNVVSWSALIMGYVQQGKGCDALICFSRMQSEGLSPDVVTYICILKACSSMGDIDKGRQIHDEIVSRGLLEKDIVLGNALVDMYAKCGAITKAQQVLEELHARDVISWSTLIAGYAKQALCHEALNCLEQMQKEGLSPNMVTYICLLKACGSIGALDIGKKVHDEIVRRGLLEDSVVGTALVDMYASCGMLIKAQEVLEELPIQDVTTWNALIAGYAQQGQGQIALNCLVRMQREGLYPDEITCLCVLSACGRSGLWEEAQLLYGDMDKKFGITPMPEHHSSVVVGLGFAGQFDKAIAMIEVMPSSNYLAVWIALLGSCRKWGNVKLGTLAFDQALQVDTSCASAYVLMTDIFASVGMQDDAEKVEAMRVKYASA